MTAGRTLHLSRDPLGFNPDAPGNEELAAHFANLRALRPGTTLAVASGGIKRVGRFIGVDHSREEPYLIIEQRAGEKKQEVHAVHRSATRTTSRSAGCLRSAKRAIGALKLLAKLFARLS